jgi:hypothetical protein
MVRFAAAVAGLSALLIPASAAGKAVPPQLVVRLYDALGVGEAARIAARDTAHFIFSHAGIDLIWRDCDAVAQAKSSSTSCDHPLEPREVLVRVVAGSSQTTGEVLGYSSIDTRQSAGWLATVFADRVDAVATRTQSDMGRLLGRAIAHEVGHLLLGTTTHSPSGLMRERWRDQELHRDRAWDWMLSSSDARGVRQALLSRVETPDAPIMRVASTAR